MVSKNKSKSKKANGTGKNRRVITAPVAQSYIVRQPQMRFASRKDGIVFTNSERFSAVGTSGTAGAYVDSVIPIIPSRFPYLAGVAANFSNFRWKALKFTYVTSASTTTSGKHGMAFIYDPADGPITSLTQLSALQGAILHPLWAGGVHGMGVGPGGVMTMPDKSRYDVCRRYKGTTAFDALSNSDKLLFASTWLITATAGSSDTSLVAGDIFCDYTVELTDPIPSSIQS